jgi:DNA-binding response OmpR family regulator
LNVQVVRDGQEALDYLRDNGEEPAGSPILVLLDLNIPKVTGLEILRELRSSPQHHSVPVIVVTSSGADSDRAAAGALRIEGYFKKPTSMTKYRELSSLVRNVLQGVKPGD